MYPGYRGSKRKDKYPFTLLTKEIMEAFKAEAQTSGKARLLLTDAVAAYIHYDRVGHEKAEVSQYLNFISVMTLDFSTGIHRVTGHNRPLYDGQNMYRNIDYILKYWRDQGTPGEKILVTFLTYGNTYSLKTNKTGVGAPVSKGGEPGPYSSRRGFMAYKDVCTFLKSATKQMIEDQKIPYAVKGNQWLGYDEHS
ncbi:acidic mammalian chitinase-like [Mustelus asterias]